VRDLRPKQAEISMGVRVRFGVSILNFGAGTDPSTLLAWARYAEERGFHFAMISDHVAITPDVAELYPAPFHDPLPRWPG
jgi:alkanesulfonate monooxygenase SsuD/methylene tetrahydromethanopterin reductase-like flavin-dependent oxidoreductase (luciferase family)